MIYDFLVIGGGIAGASAAYELAGYGSVLVLEAEQTAGFHATGRSAALFTRNYGGPVVRQINARSAAFYRVPPQGFCDTPLLSARGCIAVAPEGAEGDLDAVLALSEPGEEIIEIGPKDACQRVPFLRPERVSRAVYEANVTDIDVATLHQSYLKGAKARGAMILTQHSVTALTQTLGVWDVQTGNDWFSAAKVINAAGAWADQIGRMAGAHAIGLVPKRRTGIIINAPDGLDVSAMPVVDFVGFDGYLKPDAGRLMASPGDATPVEPHDAWPDDMDIAVLVDRLQQETTLKVTKIEHSWAGLRSFVADDAPVVGFDGRVPGFFWLAGQGGFGIMMSPVLAQLTAELCTRTKGTLTSQLAPLLTPDRLR